MLCLSGAVKRKRRRFKGRIAFVRSTSTGTDIYVMNDDGNAETRLTSAGWSGAIDFSASLGAFAQSDLVPCITFAALGAVLLLVATRAKSPSAG